MNKWWEGKRILAIDEAGRGPLAGPLVVAGCIFKHTIDEEHLAKIRDSKKISEKKRNELFNYIKTHSHFKISIIHSEEIDEIGINGAVERGVREVYETLKHKAVFTIFDGSWDPIIEKGFLVMTDADEHVKQASAASILAKVTRDKIMSEYFAKKYPQYLFEKHKGYGTKEHRELIKQYGRCKIHRKSFKIRGYD
jgi:ribonuclease HII